MRAIDSSSLLRAIAANPCAAERFPRRARFRREALALIEREDLIKAAYCYRIVALDEPPDDRLRAGGEGLDALRLVPESGRLTAVAAAVCTLGPALEQRTSQLFAQRQQSLALALDGAANELLFMLSRRLQDRIVVDARKHQLTAAGELRAGDPGLPLAAQPAVLRLAGAAELGVSVSRSQLLHPLKSISMLMGIGIDLPQSRWSRCDECPSASKCQIAGQGLSAAP